jgi:hypothetical protein
MGTAQFRYVVYAQHGTATDTVDDFALVNQIHLVNQLADGLDDDGMSAAITKGVTSGNGPGHGKISRHFLLL